MIHTCHAHGCTTRVPPKIFMCKTHWFALRKPMRDAIWAEYVPGQEDTKDASVRYLVVQQRAIGEVAFKPNDEAAAAIAAPYFVRSELLRQRCRDEGLGDPLERVVNLHGRIGAG